LTSEALALNQLPKMFVVFAVLLDGQWVDFEYEQEEDEQLRETENYNIFLEELLNKRKQLFSKGEYILEEGEILE